MEVSGHFHPLAALHQEKEPPVPIVQEDPRVGLDDMEKLNFLTLPGLELRPLGRPACTQSLYRLSYSGLDRFGA
jgi:hypothetical protein